MNGNLNLIPIMLGVAALVLLRYVRSTTRPIRGRGFRILLPLLFISPGLLLIANPNAHSPAWMWIGAFLLGGLLSLPLIYTTGYEIRENGAIYAKRSLWFLAVFAVVLGIRFALRSELQQFGDAQTNTALFMAMAMGYVIPWRVASYLKYRRLLAAADLCRN
jgi:membrane protein CcdC involved in cytochrome C biogenesis